MHSEALHPLKSLQKTLEMGLFHLQQLPTTFNPQNMYHSHI